MRTIERNGESELKQKLPTPGSQDNGIKMDFVVVGCLSRPLTSLDYLLHTIVG